MTNIEKGFIYALWICGGTLLTAMVFLNSFVDNPHIFTVLEGIVLLIYSTLEVFVLVFSRTSRGRETVEKNKKKFIVLHINCISVIIIVGILILFT